MRVSRSPEQPAVLWSLRGYSKTVVSGTSRVHHRICFEGMNGCGGRIRTDDLKDMSLASYRCSTPQWYVWSRIPVLPRIYSRLRGEYSTCSVYAANVGSSPATPAGCCYLHPTHNNVAAPVGTAPTHPVSETGPPTSDEAKIMAESGRSALPHRCCHRRAPLPTGFLVLSGHSRMAESRRIERPATHAAAPAFETGCPPLGRTFQNGWLLEQVPPLPLPV